MPETSKPIVVEFNVKGDHGKDWIMGATLEGVLKDTNGGTRFAFAEYDSHRVLSEIEVARLKFETYKLAVESITSGRSKTWYLASSDPRHVF